MGKLHHMNMDMDMSNPVTQCTGGAHSCMHMHAHVRACTNTTTSFTLRYTHRCSEKGVVLSLPNVCI